MITIGLFMFIVGYIWPYQVYIRSLGLYIDFLIAYLLLHSLTEDFLEKSL